jgi:hypothetical protein
MYKKITRQSPEIHNLLLDLNQTILFSWFFISWEFLVHNLFQLDTKKKTKQLWIEFLLFSEWRDLFNALFLPSY